MPPPPSTRRPAPRVRTFPLGDTALLAELGTRLDTALNTRAIALATALKKRRDVRQAVAGYATVTVHFDPDQTTHDALGAAIKRLAAKRPPMEEPGRLHRIPVVYEGPDLEEVAARLGLTPERVAELHSTPIYRVFLVGNAEGDAGLECTLSGPTLVAVHSCLVAITGADFDPRVNGRPVPGWTGIFLGLGDRLTFGARRSGGRAYIAVAGGVAGDRWLGSTSTYLLAARGGIHGRNLKAGDEISLAREFGGPLASWPPLPCRVRPPLTRHTTFA